MLNKTILVITLSVILVASTLSINNAFAITETKIIPSDGAERDQFGYSVSIDGDTAIVGALNDDDAGVSDAGSAYIFTRSGTEWTQAVKLTASDAAAGDLFGYSVSIDGDTAIVGAINDDDDDAGIQSGSAYIFTRSGTEWTQAVKLTASDAAASDWFGDSVSIDGDTAIVGARGGDSAYIFTRSGTEWTQAAKLTASDGAAGDWFGVFVSIDGDTAIVGAVKDDDAGVRDAGSAYIFTRSGTEWTQAVKLTASDAAASDWFGHFVSIDGDTAIVGAVNDDDAGVRDAGSAYIFTRSGTEWTQAVKLTASDAAAGDQFGYFVSIDGDTAIVGAINDDDAGTSSGSAYIFTRSGTEWTQAAKLTASDAAAYDWFGISVSIDGDTAIVGALRDDDAGNWSGSAYIYEITTDTIPPMIGPVSDIIQDATGTDGVTINYDLPTVTDDTDPNPTISCEPASGSLFPIGTTVVTCTAENVLGNTSTASFSVIVLPISITFDTDTTITTDTFIAAGDTWTVNPGVTLTIDSGVDIDNSGTFNNFGIINNSGTIWNIENGSTINNNDTINNEGSIINVDGTINNNYNGTFNNDGSIGNENIFNNGGIISNSGTIHSIGVISNSGSINNDNGTINNPGTINNIGTINNEGLIDNSFGTINNSCNGILRGTIPTSGNAVIQELPFDPTLPRICPVSDITQDATGPDGATINYDLPTVTDDTDPNPTISCDPVSGSLFPIGTTVVTCTAENVLGNTSTASFSVIVLPISITFDTDTTITTDTFITEGEIWTVNPGVTLTIDSGVTINNEGTINDFGTIDNNGTIDNEGLIDNSFGTINNNDNGTINNEGTIWNIESFSGTINNFGTINNNGGIVNEGGTINNNDNGIINNFGTILSAFSTINNIGTINNEGTIDNHIDILDNTGTINNEGTIDNIGLINNIGTINNNDNGTINNFDFANCSNCFGTINNFDTIDNKGLINNDNGTIINNDNDTIINNGTINNCNGILTGTIPTSGNAVVLIQELCDIIPPTIDPVSDITQDATGTDGATINYDLPEVTDDTDPNPTISCEPESGSLFPVGATTVTCTAEDVSGNNSTVEFNVIVLELELFCNDMTIDQLISSGNYNVIDNRDGAHGKFLSGTFLDDLILASDAGDAILGWIGDDCIIGGAGNDVIKGEKGWDIIFGGNGNDRLIGGLGNDLILGGSGDDVISGGFGDDSINGEDGNDILRGQPGSDYITGGAGDDIINGGIGEDTCISDAEDTDPAQRCEL